MSTATSWKLPGTAASVDRGASEAWTNPDYIKVDDSNAASNIISKDDYSDWIHATNFGFDTGDVPEGVTILGIEVKINRKASAIDTVEDSALYLLDAAGLQAGDNKASGTNWPSEAAEVTYGGAADDWNADLDDTDIRHANFGIRLSAQNLLDGQTSTAWVYCVQIRVHYTTVTNYDHSGVVVIVGVTKKYVLQESYTPTADQGLAFDGDTRYAQCFTPTASHPITRIKIPIYAGTVAEDTTFSILATDGESKPTGDALCTGTLLAADIPDSTGWPAIVYAVLNFDPVYDLVADTKYCIEAKKAA